MRRVVIESPYAGDTERNLAYLRDAMADCLARGEAPYASHGLYTQPGVLDDTDPDERALGIAAGMRWALCCDAVVVYADIGYSLGMAEAVVTHRANGHHVELRHLPGWRQPPTMDECVDEDTGQVQYRRICDASGERTLWHDSEAQADAAWAAVETVPF